MMLKRLGLISVATAMFGLGGCATSFPVGSLMTDVTYPVNATGNSGKASKKGEAECQSILTLVAQGDCSIEAAAKDGGITKIHHVDWHANNILGIIGKYKVTVYGD